TTLGYRSQAECKSMWYYEKVKKRYPSEMLFKNSDVIPMTHSGDTLNEIQYENITGTIRDNLESFRSYCYKQRCKPTDCLTGKYHGIMNFLDGAASFKLFLR